MIAFDTVLDGQIKKLFSFASFCFFSGSSIVTVLFACQSALTSGYRLVQVKHTVSTRTIHYYSLHRPFTALAYVYICVQLVFNFSFYFVFSVFFLLQFSLEKRFIRCDFFYVNKTLVYVCGRLTVIFYFPMIAVCIFCGFVNVCGTND